MPEPAPAWAEHLVQRRGVLHQRRSPRAEALCLDVVGHSLLLAPIVPAECSALEPNCPTVFEVTHPSGITRLSGLLTRAQEALIGRAADTALRLVVDPESVVEVNRRALYRVGVSLKGEIAALIKRDGADSASGDSRERAGQAPRVSDFERPPESVAGQRRPCVVRDLSVGGARLAMSSPPLGAGQEALLDLIVGNRGILRNLRCRVVEGRSGVTPPPFDASVRVRFVATPPRHEALLSRYVAEVQLEMLRKGVRG